MTSIDEKTLKHLAELARIEIDKKHEKKLLGDLQKILNHFEELKEANTEGVEPMAGGTSGKNVFREDVLKNRLPRERSAEVFPEQKDGYLKIPPVFPAEGGSPPEADAPWEHASGGE